jgi:hypothetical protein
VEAQVAQTKRPLLAPKVQERLCTLRERLRHVDLDFVWRKKCRKGTNRVSSGVMLSFSSPDGTLPRRQTTFGLYVFEYGVGAFCPPHRDFDFEGCTTRRCVNLIWALWRAESGGRLQLRDPCRTVGRIAAFPGHEREHLVTTVRKGRRVALACIYATNEFN